MQPAVAPCSPLRRRRLSLPSILSPPLVHVIPCAGAVRPRRALLALALAATLAPAASAQTASLRTRLDAIFDRPATSNAFWGVSIADATTGEVLYRRNADRSLMPASNMKLYTTAAALDLFGADHRFTTRLYADGPVEGATLRGNLVVRGGGDPTLGGAYFADQDKTDRLAPFRAFADSLRARGITRIEGDVVGDDDVFDDLTLGYGWAWDDLNYYYSTEISGLSAYDNCVDVTIAGTTPGQPGRVTWEPLQTDYVSFVNRTLTRGAGTGVRERYERPLGSNAYVLASRVGSDTRDTECLAVSNATRFAASLVRDVLAAEGIAVSGEDRDADEQPGALDYDRMTRVATWRSVPMDRIAEAVNKESVNLYADALLKAVGTLPGAPAATDDDPLGSHARGVAVATRRVWGPMGVDTAHVSIVDGSGLSRMDLVTANSTVALLRAMNRHRDAAVRRAFYESLPVGGVDGTLRNRYRDAAGANARSNVRAKTGSLGGVSSLSGYVTTRGGRRLAFSLMCNHYTVGTSAIRSAQDAAVNVLAGLP